MAAAAPLSDLFTYSLDGEGRVYSIIDTTTDAPILGSTTYNSASQPTAVLSESFQYDANSGRMTQWASTVGSDTQTGSPTWNANGTLQSMQINDNANNANTQNCAYTYDDLARLHSVNCGANTWQQNFSYDVLGNITKTVPTGGTGVTFNNGYGSGNHVSGFSYDGMGNVTLDNLGNHYTYDAEGRPVSAAGVTTTYDAFGRAVGNSNGGGTQIVYSPTGGKFALMNGSSLIKYRVPMPGGLVATHNGDGSGYYQHADWLGSSRFATSAGVRYDRAYAPFGEVYAELNGNMENRTFTGPQEDTTPGIDDFLFRQYSASQGRWLVPDPAGMAAVDITNPQTWNRYAYLANNPLNAVDPKGLFCAVGTGCAIVWDPEDGIGGVIGGGDFSVGSGGTGTPDSGSSGEVDCGWVCHFFSGSFSGVWTQSQLNDWVSQQWWQQQKFSENDPLSEIDVLQPSLWSSLPQNQNPNAQATISEGQYISDLPETWVQTRPGGPNPPPPVPVYIPGAPLPQSNPFPSGYKRSSGMTIKSCEKLYPPGPERTTCIVNVIVGQSTSPRLPPL